ncbi:MAG: hypothetical protein M1549_01220 [Candidatus Dependentiae bacterium]|nr:hypothetical protein [Candidatus Dependentiae bacterium]
MNSRTKLSRLSLPILLATATLLTPMVIESKDQHYDYYEQEGYNECIRGCTLACTITFLTSIFCVASWLLNGPR